MQVLRKTIESNKLTGVIDIPEEMKNTIVELTIKSVKSSIQFDPAQYKGILKIDNVQEQLEIMRDEWERN